MYGSTGLEAPPAWLLRQSAYDLAGPSKSDLKYDFGLKPPSTQQVPTGTMQRDHFGGHTFDVQVDALCDSKPRFEKAAREGTFMADLEGVLMRLTTSCSPEPCFRDGVTMYRPDLEIFVPLPEMRHVILDSRTAHQPQFVARARKQECLFEVSLDNALNAKLRTDTPSGSLTLEDVVMRDGRRETVGKAILHYELTANGKLSVKQTSQAHQLFVDFDLEFKCWLTSASSPTVPVHSPRVQPLEVSNAARLAPMSLHEVPAESQQVPAQPHQADCHVPSHASSHVAPSSDDADSESTQARRVAYRSKAHRLSNVSEMAMGELLTTDRELLRIETRVSELAGEASGATGTDLALLRSELAQLETKAKQLETKGVDDIYTGELQSGKQLAKETKRDMLRRFEALYSAMDDLFATLKAGQK